MKSYLEIVRTILDTGWTKKNRTGIFNIGRVNQEICAK